MCAGANRQRSHLWDHPGLLPRLRVQRWLQLAAVVKAAEGVARLGWNCFISFIIMIIIVLVLRLPFCSCICYLWWWPPSHINRQQQTSAIHGPFYFYCCFFFYCLYHVELNWHQWSRQHWSSAWPRTSCWLWFSDVLCLWLSSMLLPLFLTLYTNIVLMKTMLILRKKTKQRSPFFSLFDLSTLWGRRLYFY